MKRLAILFALVFIIPFTVQAEEFRVATYNCKNLFDFHDDPYVREDSLMGLMKGKPHEEVRQLARVIRAVDADIVALQEVESKGLLREFVREVLNYRGYPSEKRYTRIVLIEGNDSDTRSRGIDVALIARSNVNIGAIASYQNIVVHPGSTKKGFSRDLLQVEAEVDGLEFNIFVVHLKSRLGDSIDQRAREAQRVRKIITERGGPNFIVCGDFNDSVEDADPLDDDAVKTIVGSVAPILTVVDAEDNNGRTYTHLGSGVTNEDRGIRFDYILVSPQLAQRLVSGSAEVFRGGGSVTGADVRKASDHFPVYVDFSTPE